MAKVQYIILFLLLCNFCFSQVNSSEECNIEAFETYLNDADDFSNIRTSPAGEIVLKLSNIVDYGYIVNIIGMENEWLKINHIMGISDYDISNFEGWVHNSIVEAGTTHDLDVFKSPNGVVKTGELRGEQDTFKILEVYCEWIKVESKNITGWVESNKICGNPVTTCP